MQKGSLLLKNLEGKFTKLTEFCKKPSGLLSAEVKKMCGIGRQGKRSCTLLSLKVNILYLGSRGLNVFPLRD